MAPKKGGPCARGGDNVRPTGMRIFSILSLVLYWSSLRGVAQQVLFADGFKGKLGPGRSWVREHRDAWRASERGLEVLIEPGNVWGPQNDARNVLVRSAQ